jgi:hypothetical protein
MIPTCGKLLRNLLFEKRKNKETKKLHMPGYLLKKNPNKRKRLLFQSTLKFPTIITNTLCFSTIFADTTMTSPLPLLRSQSTEAQSRDWTKRFSLRVNKKPEKVNFYKHKTLLTNPFQIQSHLIRLKRVHLFFDIIYYVDRST